MKGKLFLLLSVLVIGGILRFQHYWEIPAVGDSFDEYSNAWVGLSLIETGVPVGAMGVGGYSNTRYDYVNVDRVYQTGLYPNPMLITWPWFDHPPLMGLLSGGFAITRGARIFESTTLRIIRIPTVVLGVVSVLLVFLLAWQLYGFTAGFFAGILYATSPLVVVSSRMVQAENGFIPLFLLAMIFAGRYLKTDQPKFLFWAIFMAGIGLWFKVSAIAIVLALFIVLPKRNWIKIIAYYLPFILAWICYGLILGGKTFLSVFLANSSRVYGIGPHAVYELFTLTRITHMKFMTDGWMLAGWIAMGGILSQMKKHLLVSAAIGSYLIIFLVFGSYPHGWYMLPFWPFVFIGLGRVFSDGYKGLQSAFLAGVLAIVPIGILVNKLIVNEQFLVHASLWKWGIGVILVGLLVFRKSNKFIIGALLLGGVVLNIWYLQQITPEYWFKIS